MMEGFRVKIEKVNAMKKKVKQGNRECVEVLKARKDIEETVTNIQKEKILIESTMEELKKIN